MSNCRGETISSSAWKNRRTFAGICIHLWATRKRFAGNFGKRRKNTRGLSIFAAGRTVGLMFKLKIRLQVNVAFAAEAEGGRGGEDFQVAVCTGVVEQAF